MGGIAQAPATFNMRVMRLLQRLFQSAADPRATMVPLYRSVVAEARQPDHYAAGGVPDTTDGRFAMVAHVLALVLLRLEREGEPRAREAVLLTECFIADMDASLREMGIGDVVVGKQIGKMMSLLGGITGALRAVEAGQAPLAEALTRNLYAGAPPGAEAVAHETGRIGAIAAALDQADVARLISGTWQ